MDMRRLCSRRWCGEEREQEVEDLITVQEGETGVKNGLHRVGQEGYIVSNVIDSRNHVEAARLERDPDCLKIW